MNDRTKDYVFLSYSHSDNIENIIKGFNERDYNIVYDVAMSYGEEWDLNARRYISSDKCKGVIFLLSESSLTSKAVLTELEYTNHFKKKFFSIMLNDHTIAEIYKSTIDSLDENKKYIFDCIRDYLPKEQLFVTASRLDWERIKATFNTWGFKAVSDENEELITRGYTSSIKGEKERLSRQANGYYDFDMRAINLVLNSFERGNLTVLDIGCSNGALTFSRFASDNRIKKVIGVDYNQADIAEANVSAAQYGDKFKFYCLDLEDANLMNRLEDILSENHISKIDIVFAALVLHHLKRPKILLLKLYDIFSDDGKIIVRGSDDGGKLCYPKTELLREILERYDNLVKVSDRSNGRKLYGQLYSTGYVDIKMLYSVTDTCEKDRKSKENFYKVGFGFRLNTIDSLIALNPTNTHLASEREWLSKALQELQQAFYERDFWYSNTSYIAIAGVK